MQLKISNDTPTDINLWNKLCEENGNLVQSTHFDKLTYYPSKKVFFEVYIDNILIGGVKFSLWETKKFKIITAWLNKSLTQFGEFVINDEMIIPKVRKFLLNNLKAFLIQEKIICYTVNGYYGNTKLLLDLEQKPDKFTEFNVAYIDLLNTENELWNNIHSKHKNVIRKAINNNVKISVENEFDDFYKLLVETYSSQNKLPPNKYYLNDLFVQLQSFTKIYFAKHNNAFLSSSLINYYGSVAYYSFSGTIKNGIGASNYLQWFVIQDLKNNNCSRYILGQVAKDTTDTNNIKFNVGISKYKKRFGCQEMASFKKSYVLHKFKNNIWNFLLNILIYFRNNKKTFL